MKERNYLYIFLAPCILYVFVVRILPACFTLFLSLTEYNLLRQNAPRYIGLGNYVKLFSDPSVAHSLWVTLIFTVTSTMLALIMGLAIAILFDREMRGKNIMLGIVLAPMIITPVVVGTLWYILYHPTIGPLNYFLGLFGVTPIAWLRTAGMALTSLIISDVWQWTPFMALLLLSVLQGIPLELYEAAKIDGASGRQIFRHITLPLIKDIIIISAILRSMDAFREFDKVLVLTGGGPGNATEVASMLIYRMAFTSLDMGYASAMIVIVLAILSCLYFFYARSSRAEENIIS